MGRKKRRAPEFASRLRQLRKRHGLSQGELAERIGTTQVAVSDYELGHSLPTIPIIISLARALGVSTDELLGVKPIRSAKEEDEGLTSQLTSKMKAIRALPTHDQRAIFRVINAILRDHETRGET